MSHLSFDISRRVVLLLLLALGAASAAQAAVTQTTGSGGATTLLQGTSSGGALQGEVSTSATTNLNYPFGLFGTYDYPNSSTIGIGVVGMSTTGYGVAGASSGTHPAIFADALGSGVGLEAVTPLTSSNSAVEAVANGSGDAVYGKAQGGGIGVEAVSSTGFGLNALSEAGGAAYAGAPTGEGVVALGYSGTSSHPGLTVSDVVGGSDLFGAYAHTGLGPFESFIVQGKTINRSGVAFPSGSDVQISGDLYVYGQIYQDCAAFPAASTTDCYEVAQGPFSSARPAAATTAVTRTASGRNVQMYSSRQSVPTVEDFGSSQLASGRGYVQLDPAFVQTMSQSTQYMVFLTPSGDSRGLYVSNRTLHGFEVHENGGGRSTLAFDYRIVARPYADASVRLAAVAQKQNQPLRADPAIAARIAQIAKLRAQSRVKPAIRDIISPVLRTR